ncbi:MAG: glycosyltransferase [Parcubacteria group bacterium]|nr:glycosyltransferase [Parcubacteria group bacterium]
MFNMSSYAEWERGAYNRNCAIFNELKKRPDIGRIICIDFLPFTFRRAARALFETIINGARGETTHRNFFTKIIRVENADNQQCEIFIYSSIIYFFSKKRFLNELNFFLSSLQPHDATPMRRILWSCFPMFGEYDRISRDLFVFDTVDNWLEHSSLYQWRETLERNYNRIAREADILFTVSNNLIDFWRARGREERVYWISNGVEGDAYQKIYTIPKDLQKIPKPWIGYVGTIENRIDYDLLEYIARAHQDKSFILVGPIWNYGFVPNVLRNKIGKSEIQKRFAASKNIYFFGRKSHQKSAEYIMNFDACFIPHKIDEFNRYTFSMKALEYIAAGKPIITTATSGVENLGEYCYIARNKEEFSAQISLALQQKKSINRMDFLKTYSWKTKVDEMVQKM